MFPSDVSHSDCCQARFNYVREEKGELNECKARLPLKNQTKMSFVETDFICSFIFFKSVQNYFGPWVLAGAALKSCAKSFFFSVCTLSEKGSQQRK